MELYKNGFLDLKLSKMPDTIKVRLAVAPMVSWCISEMILPLPNLQELQQFMASSVELNPHKLLKSQIAHGL